ncbi:inositol monophosphatase family protein [Cellulomonas denverensis]|uniref:Inositol-1-monophosphatase n=1 Tax=Cellulomonas denverensis TaxID=264297 RepID=A0A7X6KWH2_9CELL|nr:inositol monophosphatase family protein [Cellulomonas denverensis]NKY23308.1 inositol monophosphatase [Cellulomonas denverensis]GIG24403.1 putative inositol-1-monophosphatase SuhB [Cellulomonas denverensis]
MTENRTDLPTADDIRALRELADHLARSAGDLVRRGRPDRVDVAATKSSEVDPVTAMDLASEAHLRSLIAEHRPGDAILGEEDGLLPGSTGITWVLDPIDGTVNYLYGVPAYAVSVGVVVGEPDPAHWTPVAGAVHSIPMNVTYTAGRGLGATRDGEPLRVNPARTLATSLVGTGFGYTVERRTRQAQVLTEVLPRVRDIRRIGSAALDLCRVAEGTLDAYYERGLNPWDLAAGQLMIQEAGGTVTGLRGAAAGLAMTVAGPQATVNELAAMLAELDADQDL